MMSVRAVIKKRQVLTYFALTFAISWGATLVVVGPGGIPVSPGQTGKIGMATLLGPSLASILLIGVVYGKAGFRELLSRLLRWRAGTRWYAIAILIAPLSTLAVLLALSSVSPQFLPVLFTADEKVGLLLAGIVGGVVVGIFEELGWTGFAIPQMRPRLGILATGLIVGLLWGAWHLLLFLERDSFAGVLPLALLLARLFSWLPAYRVLVVWVYDRTESLLVAMLMHVSLVASLAVFEPPMSGAALLTFILIRAAVLWAIVVVIAAANKGRLSRQPR
jgi:membrane protease YdiL (CAAX protease family)